MISWMTREEVERYIKMNEYVTACLQGYLTESEAVEMIEMIWV